VPPEENIVYAVPIMLHLTFNGIRKVTLPVLAQDGEILLEFDGRRASRLLQELQARDTTIPVKNQKAITLRPYERHFIDLPSL
jgi:hypothetical protein